MSNLIRLVYVSTSTSPIKVVDGAVHSDIGRILMQSRKNNPKQKIGGVLYFSNNCFFQCLEGEEDLVNELYQKISTDPRHENLKRILVKDISKRQFGDWSMKYVALKDNVTGLLEKKGMSVFDPYVFDENMVDEMLSLFITGVDSTPPDQNNNNASIKNKTKGLFSKLFSK